MTITIKIEDDIPASDALRYVGKSIDADGLAKTYAGMVYYYADYFKSAPRLIRINSNKISGKIHAFKVFSATEKQT